jgi:hypothetical protein
MQSLSNAHQFDAETSSSEDVGPRGLLLLPLFWAVIFIELVFSMACPHAFSQSGPPLIPVADERTGVKLALPKMVLSSPSRERTLNGGRLTNWRSIDRRLDIDAIHYTERSLDDLYEKLTSLPGRTIHRQSRLTDEFEMTGFDRNVAKPKDPGHLFYVRYVRRSHDIKGLSIVYAMGAKTELADMVQAIIRSFEPFPDVKDKPQCAEQARLMKRRAEQIVQTEAALRDLGNAPGGVSGIEANEIRSIHAALSKAQAEAEKVWREKGCASQ